MTLEKEGSLPVSDMSIFMGVGIGILGGGADLCSLFCIIIFTLAFRIKYSSVCLNGGS